MLKKHNMDYDVETFWKLTDLTKMEEKYKIDKNLQSLKYLPLSNLKKIFIQYRYFTHYYISDLAILISKMPFGKLRSILANILDEEMGDGNELNAHPALYDDFLLSIGVPSHMLNYADPYCLDILDQIQKSLHTHSWAYGVGLRGMGGECLCQIYLSTMHAFFSQNLSILGMQHKIEWKFWDIHIGEVDLHHQKIVRAAINELIILNPAFADDLIAGYIESKKAWDLFWAQIFKAAQMNINEAVYASS